MDIASNGHTIHGEFDCCILGRGFVAFSVLLIGERHRSLVLYCTGKLVRRGVFDQLIDLRTNSNVQLSFYLISYTDYSILNLFLQNAHIVTVAESGDDLCSSKLRTPALPHSSSQVW